MQLFARNSSHHIVSANGASRQENYFCLECSGLVRVRGGFHRHVHFYHIDPERPCRQHGKTIEHLQVQLYLKNCLNESELEVPFREINRIADVVWFPKKIIFEVQCSPITPDEIRARNADYASLGYQVVWVLHDSRYNRQRLSGGELSLRFSPHYFTNMDAEGNGCIYDQYDFWKRGQRRHKLGMLPINVSICKEIPGMTVHHLRVLHQRMRHWAFHFEGDLLDNIQTAYIQEALKLEAEPIRSRTWKERIKDIWHYVCVRPYLIGLQILLERASR